MDGSLAGPTTIAPVKTISARAKLNAKPDHNAAKPFALFITCYYGSIDGSVFTKGSIARRARVFSFHFHTTRGSGSRIRPETIYNC